MSDTTQVKKVRKQNAPALKEKEIKEVNDLISKFDKNSLSDTQRALVNLFQKEKKTTDDLKSIRTLKKFELEKINAIDIVRKQEEKEKQLAKERDEDFSNKFFSAISDGKKFDDNISFKQILQRMIDDKIISNVHLYSEFLKTSPDVLFEKSNISQNLNVVDTGLNIHANS